MGRCKGRCNSIGRCKGRCNSMGRYRGRCNSNGRIVNERYNSILKFSYK
jgi:hypothetical protein